jgi:hypothetical protein
MKIRIIVVFGILSILGGVLTLGAVQNCAPTYLITTETNQNGSLTTATLVGIPACDYTTLPTIGFGLIGVGIAIIASGIVLHLKRPK